MAKISKVEDVDKNMKERKDNSNNLSFKDPKKSKKFLIEGLAFFEKEHLYRRLPVNCKDTVTDAVYWLSKMPSGGQIRFRSNATKIVVHVKSSGEYMMPHMTKVGQQGLDLYYKEKGQRKYNFYTSTTFSVPSSEFEVVLFAADMPETRDFIINLPLYQAMDDVMIGFNKEAKLFKPRPHKHQGRILIYGTSVTQGGCANRPGMAFTNILSRKMDYEFINLGFSGSGMGEIEMANLICTIDNLDMLILDYEANGNSNDLLYQTLEPFIDRLRKTFPSIPLVVMSKTPFSVDLKNNQKGMELRNKFYVFQRNMVEKKKAAGDNNIYFVDGNKLFGNVDVDECTVDGYHPTDLGFYLEAKNLYPILTKILKNK